MIYLICLVTTILVSALGVQGSGLHQIVGGTRAKRCEFPHIVFVYTSKNGNTYGCGGSLIDDRHVLTAGHCVHGDVKRIDVRFGSLNKFAMPIKIRISSFAKHPGFQIFKRTVLNDVAVLTLSKPVSFTSCIKPIRMANPGEKFVGECTIAGWGRTGSKLPTSDRLIRADIPLMDKASCTKANDIIFDQHICGGSGHLHDKTTCQGDSGGPLMCKSAVDGVRVLAGIVSYGWQCDNSLAIFAKVSHFLSWINLARGS